MKTVLLIFSMIFLVSCRHEVEDTSLDKDRGMTQENIEIIDPVEIQPSPQGGYTGLHRYLAANLKYPSSLRHGEVASTIFVKFVINENGSVSDAEILRGSTNTDLNAHLIDVLNRMPKWTNESGVKMKYILPIPFNTE